MKKVEGGPSHGRLARRGPLGGRPALVASVALAALVAACPSARAGMAGAGSCRGVPGAGS